MYVSSSGMHPSGECVMGSHSIYQFRSAAAPAAIAIPSSSSGTVISICDSPAFVQAVENPPKSDADGLGCVRAVRAAFVLEGGLALFLYGVWHLWHLIH